MTPTERIRVALARSEAARQSVQPPTIEAVPELPKAAATKSAPMPARKGRGSGSPGFYTIFLAAIGCFAVGAFSAYVMSESRSASANSVQMSVAPAAESTTVQAAPARVTVSARVRTVAEEQRFIPHQTAEPVVPQRVVARRFTPPVVSRTATAPTSTEMLDPVAPAAVAAPPVNVAALRAITEPARTAAPQPRVGGMVLPGVLLHSIPPRYPPLARSARVEGTVVFHAIIGRDGHIREADFVSGPEMLVQAARQSVMQWTYRPSMLDGAPIESTTQIEVRFKLSH